MDDCLIVGAGVVGLSLAYELSSHGLRVRVIDRGTPGQESSWAGAGLLPPAPRASADPLDQLAALSNGLHSDWAERLKVETGIDNGYLRSGAVYAAQSTAEAESLRGAAVEWSEQGIVVEALPAARLAQIEPALAEAPAAGRVKAAYFLPDEAQIRNPRHIQALLAACLARGVNVSAGLPADGFVLRNGRVEGVRTVAGQLRAERYCLCGGAWTAGLMDRLGLPLAVRPVRGQMVLLHADRSLLRRIVNVGPRYLVPRADGRLLIGSTEEEAGFDKRTTAAGVAGLLDFGLSLLPALGSMRIEQTWAGLRPATADHRPYLGAAPGVDNLFVAAGHFRAGLQLSTGTASVMAQLLRGEPPSLDPHAFRCDRAVPL
ncbi:MAG: glycine oxidase ThiO [Pirellulales bacterium]